MSTTHVHRYAKVHSQRHVEFAVMLDGYGQVVESSSPWEEVSDESGGTPAPSADRIPLLVTVPESKTDDPDALAVAIHIALQKLPGSESAITTARPVVGVRIFHALWEHLHTSNMRMSTPIADVHRTRMIRDEPQA